MKPPSMREIAFGVAGAFRLARFDLNGLTFFDLTARGAARSFWAAALTLPAYLALADMHGDLTATPAASAELRLLQTLLSYVVSWTAFPVLVSYMTAGAAAERRFTAFLTVYNWSAVVQTALYLPAAAIASGGALSPGAASGLLLGVVLAMLCYQWFIIRVTLGLSLLSTTGLVVVDLVAASLINAAVDAVL